jgi:hypothetical protein
VPYLEESIRNLEALEIKRQNMERERRDYLSRNEVLQADFQELAKQASV